ncbi:MAG: TonB-dependent receptor [Candidatus Latescibacter sp.]|nr:TonB-dependent receptor [Candidatus Latescibacter sp.]
MVLFQFRNTLYCIVLSIFILASVCAGSLFSEEPRYSLEGKVTDRTGTAIPGALVTLIPGAMKDTTDTAGLFRFEKVPAGKYTLLVVMSRLGLEDYRLNIRLPLADPKPLAVVMKERVYESDEVVVVSRPAEESEAAANKPAMIAVVKRAEFEDRAKTVADVIMETPGAGIQTMGGLGDYTEVSLRGSNSQQVQVYIDGMLLNEANGGAVNLSTIPLSQTEQVEVWRSGAPAQFGGSAAGGVINIRTRDFLTSNRNFSVGYGSFNTMTVHSLGQFPAGKGQMLLSGGFSSSNNAFQFKSDNGTAYNPDDDYWTVRKNDGFREGNLMGKYRALIGADIILDLSEHLLSNRKELPGRDIVQNSGAWLATTRNLFQARFTLGRFFHDRLEAEPNLYHIYTREHYSDLSNTVGWGSQDNFYRTNTVRFNIPFLYRAGGRGAFTLTPGADHESYRPEQRLQRTIPLSCDREHYSLTLDASLRFIRERLVVTSTIQRERFHSTFEGQPSSTNPVTPKSSLILLTSSQGGVRFALSKNLSVSANYGDVGRAPGFYELFGDRGTTVSNPALRPERAERWDSGMKSSYENNRLPLGFSLEYAWFQNRYQDLIQWYTNDAGFLFPANVAKSWVRGTELVFSGRAGNHLSCSGNWTFQKSRVTGETNRIYRDKELPNRPGDYGSLKMKYALGRLVPFWFMNHKGAYYLDRANQPHKLYPGRTMHDIGITVPFDKLRVKMSFDIKNVTDVHTFDTQGMPLPGRSLSSTAEWGF